MTHVFKKNHGKSTSLDDSVLKIFARTRDQRLAPFITACMNNDLSFDVSYSTDARSKGVVTMRVTQLAGASPRIITLPEKPTAADVERYINDCRALSGENVSEFCPPAVRTILVKDGVQTHMAEVAYWKRQRITVSDCSMGEGTAAEQTAHYWLAFSQNHKELGRFQDGKPNPEWKGVESVSYSILPGVGPCVTIEYTHPPHYEEASITKKPAVKTTTACKSKDVKEDA